MLIEIVHETDFHYSESVTESYLELRLTPLTDGSQHLLQHRRRSAPTRPIREYVDAYGNVVAYLNVPNGHDRLVMTFESVVETRDEAFRGPAWTEAELAQPAVYLELHDFRQPTPLTEPCEKFLDFVQPLEGLRRLGPREAATALQHEIHGRFRYEGEVTDASSPIQHLLEVGGGVCQDFAHLTIASARHLGYAARYVSGYVLPEEEGEEATASHAWCEIFCPGEGWLGVDPTHDTVVGERWVRIGVGRDYRDVPPNKGLFRGVAAEVMSVRVRVAQTTAEALSPRLQWTARSVATPARTTPERVTRAARKPPRVSLAQQIQAQQQQQQ